MKKICFLLLLVLSLLSCRKSIKKPDGEQTTTAAVPIKFDAIAYDTNAVLTVEIYDTNTLGVYFKGTTSGNIYSGQTDVMQGTTVTFKVTASTNTNISSQITSSNKVVASGTFNVGQQAASSASCVLYYKVQ